MIKHLSPDDYKVAEANGISHHNAYQRFYIFGWSKERAITEPLKKARKRGSLKPFLEKALDLGISETTVHVRLRAGMSLEEASTAPVYSTRKLDRKYPKELLALADKNGIPRQTFYWRVYAGWGVERAATEPVSSTRKRREGVLDASFSNRSGRKQG